MSLIAADRLLLKDIYQRLADRPLKPGDQAYEDFYVPIYSSDGIEDPVERMHTIIEWNDVESLQMFSGFRGSGKTTELFRLRQRLVDEGYLVLYCDALSYINPAEKIDITDLLIVIAGSFSDALQEYGIDLADESYWDRIRNYLLNTSIEITEAGVKTEIENPMREVVGGLKAGLDLKLTLKSTPSFRVKVQQALANRTGELKNQVDKFIEDGVKALRKSRGDDKRIVFIFDSLEQIRGSLFNEQDVIRSVERLFTTQMKMLHLPYIHTIYTVPPWLKFAHPNAGGIILLPSVRQWNNDAGRSRYEPGWESLRNLTNRRFGDGGCAKVFGSPDNNGRYPLADRLIGSCGGHFRDLLLLFRETLTRTKSLPVSEDAVESAIRSVRSQFLPIAVENARWLHQISRLRQTALMTDQPEDINRLTRFIDTHFVLYLRNGDEWYDIHPLIRDEVDELIEEHGMVDESRDKRA